MEYNTEQEILEGNKLLAKFEGYKYYPHPNKDAGWRKENGHLKLGKGYYLARTHKHLKYHLDYNDLMRVWFKYSNYVEIKYTLKNEEDRNYYLEGTFEIYSDLPNEPIDKIFKMLVREIKWYNSVKINNEN